MARRQGGALVVVGPQGLQPVDPDTGATSEPVVLPGPVAVDARTVVVAQAGGMTGLPADCATSASPPS